MFLRKYIHIALSYISEFAFECKYFNKYNTQKLELSIIPSSVCKIPCLSQKSEIRLKKITLPLKIHL